MRKILILGTSNSILRGGWVDGLRSSLPTAQIDNRSIGASPGIQFASEIDHDFTHYDFVFFDSVPNDEEYQYNREFSGNLEYSSEKFVNDIIYQICRKISTESKLIILGFCRKQYINEISSVYENRIRIAMSLSVPFIDIRSILISYMRFYDLMVDDIYEEHPSHPNRNISKTIGSALGDIIKSNELETIFCKSKKILPNLKINFSVWRPVPGKGYDVKSISNSLFSESFAVLHNDDNINFNENGICIGFHINTCETNSSVSLSYKGKHIYNISLYYGNTPNKMLKIFIPIPHGTRLDCITVGEFSDIAMKGLLSTSLLDNTNPIKFSISDVIFYHERDSLCWDSPLISKHECMHISRKIEALSLKNLPIINSSNILLEHIRRIPSTDFMKKNKFCIKTHHNTIICANLINMSIGCYDIDTIKNRKYIIPISAEIKNKNLNFYLDIPGINIFLYVEIKSGYLKFNINNNLDEYECFNVEYLCGLFFIKYKNFYLCSQPNGVVICNRNKASHWEKFSLAYIGNNWDLL